MQAMLGRNLGLRTTAPISIEGGRAIVRMEEFLALTKSLCQHDAGGSCEYVAVQG